MEYIYIYGMMQLFGGKTVTPPFLGGKDDSTHLKSWRPVRHNHLPGRWLCPQKSWFIHENSRGNFQVIASGRGFLVGLKIPCHLMFPSQPPFPTDPQIFPEILGARYPSCPARRICWVESGPSARPWHRTWAPKFKRGNIGIASLFMVNLRFEKFW